jgi:hypothetical protein
MNIPLTLLKGIMGMKFGWVILLVVGLLIGGSLIKNIITGSFSIAKFASGFNPFGFAQGKILWLAIWTFIFFTTYQFVMRTTYTYDTNYRNNFNNQGDNLVDQRVGATCIPTKILWGFIQIGCDSGSQKKVINNIEENKEVADQKPKTNIIPRGKK